MAPRWAVIIPATLLATLAVAVAQDNPHGGDSDPSAPVPAEPVAGDPAPAQAPSESEPSSPGAPVPRAHHHPHRAPALAQAGAVGTPQREIEPLGSVPGGSVRTRGTPAITDAGSGDAGHGDAGNLDADPGAALVLAANAGLALAPSRLAHAVESAEATARREYGNVATTTVGEEHAAHPVFQVKTFILQLVNFGVLLFLLIYFGGRAMNKALRSRHQQIETEVAEAARLRRQAQEKADTQDRRLAELEKEVAMLRSTMREEAAREQARVLAGARERAQRVQDDMRLQLAQQIKAAEVLLRAEVASVSVRLAEQLARKAVDTQDERRLAQELVTGFAAPAGEEG
ncbi:MAG: hypothetical protein ABSB49_22495 [Polyangia bacterium]